MSWRNETGRLLTLAGPLIVNNLSVIGMQTVDTIMSGRLGAQTLAAVAVGASVWFFAFTILLGILMAISPISARLYGAGEKHEIGRYTRQGIYLGIGAGTAFAIGGQLALEPLLTLIPIDPGFRHLTIDYTRAIVFGAPGIFIFLALRFTTEGIGVTKPIMYTSLFALVCNTFLNWVLMFGNLGAPALGAAGCGLASAITMWVIATILIVYMATTKSYRELRIFQRLSPPRPGVLREIISLGAPIAGTITAEAGLFNALAVMMGTLGAVITAAHQIAINFAATMFMIPMALSSAITIRVGHELGAGDTRRARYAGGFGIFACGAFMTCSALFMLVFRDLIIGLYTNDPTVHRIAISLLLMAAVFQVADGVQIGAAGTLRGYKDTRVPMLINTFSYWVLGFPLAYLAAVTYRLPPNYIWGALVLGLTVAAVLLTWRFLRLSRAAVSAQAAG